MRHLSFSSRLEAGATAGWKPALRALIWSAGFQPAVPPASSRPDSELAP